MTMEYTIYFKGYGICPRCGGLLRTMKSDLLILRCIDCGITLGACGEGHADAELKFEEVKINETI